MTRRFPTASRRWIYGLLLGLVPATYWAATSLSQTPVSGRAAPRTTAAAGAPASDRAVPAVGTVAAEKPLVTTGTRQPAASANLPLKRVVLFNSGVGFFEHGGQVEGNADVQLKFNVEDVNDLLKSMVVEDLGGGQISTVSYGSKDPISKTLKSFAVDLTTNPTLFDLLQQVRGERVELEVPNRISGLIVGVEKRKEKVGDRDTIEIDVLNLLTEAGLRAIKLDTVTSIKLANEKLDSELRKALALLASSHDTDKKTVTLSFLGEGKRQVRVGYIQETPVWKTSYRLLVDDENPPLLQGWAIVENTTENDWSGVSLALVSGRPISFVMDLYQPLYVARPRVEMEFYASLRPQSYEQDLAKREAEFLARSEMAAAPAAPGMAMAGAPTADRGRRMALHKAAAGEGKGMAKADEDAAGWSFQQRGVQSAATARDVGSLFQYTIRTPVDLARQQSAMLPIVNEKVKGEKVSIYNEQVQAKHPLSGLRLINSTDLHLMQGPITVLDGGVYAGDAKIDDLPPGSQRLISYSMDLDTEVAPESKPCPEQILSVRLAKGVIYVDRKFSQAHQFTVKNSGKKAKKVLIEYPFSAAWKLVEPKEPAEKTRDQYRFAVNAKPGEPAVLTVQEERTEGQQIGLSNIDDNTIRFYQASAVTSDKVKAAMAEVIQRKAAVGQVIQKRQDLERRIQTINDDQSRIRQNMAQLDHNSDVYKTYVKKFSDEEQEIEKLRGQIQELTGQENDLRKKLDDYLMGLDLS
jgi:hypothetical protein